MEKVVCAFWDENPTVKTMKKPKPTPPISPIVAKWKKDEKNKRFNFCHERKRTSDLHVSEWVRRCTFDAPYRVEITTNLMQFWFLWLIQVSALKRSFIHSKVDTMLRSKNASVCACVRVCLREANVLLVTMRKRFLKSIAAGGSFSDAYIRVCFQTLCLFSRKRG